MRLTPFFSAGKGNWHNSRSFYLCYPQCGQGLSVTGFNLGPSADALNQNLHCHSAPRWVSHIVKQCSVGLGRPSTGSVYHDDDNNYNYFYYLC